LLRAICENIGIGFGKQAPIVEITFQGEVIVGYGITHGEEAEGRYQGEEPDGDRHLDHMGAALVFAEPS
jgi:hypothetical protein